MSARKRTSLEAVFGAQEPPAAIPPKQDRKGRSEALPIDALPGAEVQEREGESKRPNVKQHTAYLALAVHQQLRKLAFEENRKMHDYLIEGLDRVFADRGLPTVGDLS
jgi:hypothetical protein